MTDKALPGRHRPVHLAFAGKALSLVTVETELLAFGWKMEIVLVVRV